MSKSYEKVNYLLRLKKQIERKLIIETIQSLSNHLDIADYHYFGFGSIYYADFLLFHKYLNIKSMTSIDNKKKNENRFRFNKPYEFINLSISECDHFLRRKLDWSKKLIIWLDFDTNIDKTILADIEYIASQSKAFDIFLVTVEAESSKSIHEFINEFKEFISPALKPSTIKKNFPETLQGIMKSVIQNALGPKTGQLDFLQLFSLVYKDTKKMYTLGGIFCESTIIPELKHTVSNLQYIEHEDKVIPIDCPFLTPKEKIHLDALVKADGTIGEEDNIGITRDDMEKYGAYYKYYPQFFESIY